MFSVFLCLLLQEEPGRPLFAMFGGVAERCARADYPAIRL